MSLKKFQELLAKCKHVAILTGAGISAESGIPTFRGEGGLWRNFSAFDLATPEAFDRDPSLVWQFYHYRREVVANASPNAAHHAITKLQEELQNNSKQLSVITQNIDGFHQKAGTKNVIEMHGSLWRVKPVNWHGFKEDGKNVYTEMQMPLTSQLGQYSTISNEKDSKKIDLSDLPHSKFDSTKLLRPAVVWFGEMLDTDVIEEYTTVLDECDILIIVGTSGVVYPAAGFSNHVKWNGKPVVEFNLELTDASSSFDFAFQGKAGDLLPEAFDIKV